MLRSVMATKIQAGHVLRMRAEQLRKLGAHSIVVRDGAPYGRKGPVICAMHAPGVKHALPKSVSAPVQGKRVRIPVQIEEQDEFQAERL